MALRRIRGAGALRTVEVAFPCGLFDRNGFSIPGFTVPSRTGLPFTNSVCSRYVNAHDW